MLHPPSSFPSQITTPLLQKITFRMLYRCTSQKSRTPISVPMYQPLKGHPVNSRPPTSRSMLATAGSAYHFRSNSLNHSYLWNERFDSLLYVSFPPLGDNQSSAGRQSRTHGVRSATARHSFRLQRGEGWSPAKGTAEQYYRALRSAGRSRSQHEEKHRQKGNEHFVMSAAIFYTCITPA